MNRRIEIRWDNLKPRKTISGIVSIIEGEKVTSMETTAEFGIEYEISGTRRFFRIGDKYLPILSTKIEEWIFTMCSSYISGLNHIPKVYMWEEREDEQNIEMPFPIFKLEQDPKKRLLLIKERLRVNKMTTENLYRSLHQVIGVLIDTIK